MPTTSLRAASRLGGISLLIPVTLAWCGTCLLRHCRYVIVELSVAVVEQLRKMSEDVDLGVRIGSGDIL